MLIGKGVNTFRALEFKAFGEQENVYVIFMTEVWEREEKL